jgi:hypothetical protein
MGSYLDSFKAGNKACATRGGEELLFGPKQLEALAEARFQTLLLWRQYQQLLEKERQRQEEEKRKKEEERKKECVEKDAACS